MGIYQGRYKAVLVERDNYLLELARYVVLNPLRANMVKRLEDWPWSSYLASCGQAPTPAWLQTDWILAQFSPQRATAIANYVEFVHQGARLPSVWAKLQGQIFLGSVDFVKKMQAEIEGKPSLEEIPRTQRRMITQPLQDFELKYPPRQAMAKAYLSGQHTMAAIAKHFSVHYSTVSRAVKKHEAE
ncbi:MAG: addiction module toxin RelE [Gammaproteobacteria bacterium]|nr:addiction module toxin RelE [Gammaproteobacteria bacterium]